LFAFADWSLLYKLFYLSWYAGIGFVTIFIASLYPQYYHQLARNLFTAISFGFTLIVLFTPPSIYTFTTSFFIFFTTGTILYTLAILLRTLKHRQPGSIIFGTGFMIFILGVIHDIL